MGDELVTTPTPFCSKNSIMVTVSLELVELKRLGVSFNNKQPPTCPIDDALDARQP